MYGNLEEIDRRIKEGVKKLGIVSGIFQLTCVLYLFIVDTLPPATNLPTLRSRVF